MDFDKANTFIYQNARPLERAIYEYHFTGGDPGRIIDVLRAYQNDDGGFGYALEPDLRASESQPLFVEFALHTLYECGLRDAGLASRACAYIAQHADLTRGIPTLFPSALRYPRAAHWDNPAALEPSIDRLAGLVGLLYWGEARHPWLDEAVEACLARVASTPFDDAHTLRTAFILVESVAGERNVDPLVEKLADELTRANFFSFEAPVQGYALNPLHFAPTPKSFCRRLFTSAQINAHLDDLAAQQEEDGGWPIAWEPPAGAARLEWRAQRTVSALVTLKAYGREGNISSSP